MVTTVKKRVLSWRALILGATFLVLIAVLFTASPAPADPTIRWTPNTLNQVVAAGTSNAVPVSFTASENVSNVVVRVVPELQPYVQVNPSTFGSIAKGQTINLNITIASPATSLPGAFEGTIQLRSGSGKNSKTLARPLSVTVTIEWALYENSELGFAIEIPPSFVATRSSDNEWKEVAFAASEDTLERGIAPLFQVNIVDLPQNMSLLDWVKSFGVTEPEIVPVTLGGHSFLKWFESAGDSFGATSFSTLFGNDKVITITTVSADFASDPVFTEIVSSLVLAAE